MVNFHDPVELSRDYKILINLGAISDGIYMWEFFATLDYEWDVIRGRRPYRRTIWIYTVCRLATLMAGIMNLTAVNFHMTTTTNCQALTSFNFIFPNIALSLASLLILVRIAAIWNMNKPAVALATGIWATNVVFLILGNPIRSTWIPRLHSCSPLNAETSKPTIISTFATDVALLLIMLAGLFRLRRRGGGWFDLGGLLWKQGVLWLSLATVTEFIPVVFMTLNLNVALDMVFVTPTLVTMTIAATRMYRSLSDFGSNTDVRRAQRALKTSEVVALQPANLAVNSQGRVEVVVHTTHEQYMTPPTPKGQSISFVRMEHLRDKVRELGLHESAESNI